MVIRLIFLSSPYIRQTQARLWLHTLPAMSGAAAKAELAEDVMARVLRYTGDAGADEASGIVRPIGDIIESLGLTQTTADSLSRDDATLRQVGRNLGQLKSEIQSNVDRWDGRARRLSLLSETLRTRAARASRGGSSEVETAERQLGAAEEALAAAVEDEAALGALVKAEQAARTATAALAASGSNNGDTLSSVVQAINAMVRCGPGLLPVTPPICPQPFTSMPAVLSCMFRPRRSARFR